MNEVARKLIGGRQKRIIFVKKRYRLKRGQLLNGLFLISVPNAAMLCYISSRKSATLGALRTDFYCRVFLGRGPQLGSTLDLFDLCGEGVLGMVLVHKSHHTWHYQHVSLCLFTCTCPVRLSIFVSLRAGCYITVTGYGLQFTAASAAWPTKARLRDLSRVRRKWTRRLRDRDADGAGDGCGDCDDRDGNINIAISRAAKISKGIKI